MRARRVSIRLRHISILTRSNFVVHLLSLYSIHPPNSHFHSLYALLKARCHAMVCMKMIYQARLHVTGVHSKDARHLQMSCTNRCDPWLKPMHQFVYDHVVHRQRACVVFALLWNSTGFQGSRYVSDSGLNLRKHDLTISRTRSYLD
jgi:hypothetical protein